MLLTAGGNVKRAPVYSGADFWCLNDISNHTLEAIERVRDSHFIIYPISDADLDSAMSTLVRRCPNNGTTMMWGHLRSLNIVVTHSRVQESLLRVSESSVQMRQRITVQRRVYNVPAPNCLWHIDGLHCLIRWRIVLHGGIDGYSRRISEHQTIIWQKQLKSYLGTQSIFVDGHPECVVIRVVKTLMLHEPC